MNRSIHIAESTEELKPLHKQRPNQSLDQRIFCTCYGN